MERNNPRFTRLAYILAEEENETLCLILERIKTETSLLPICLLFDGAIIETPDEQSADNLKSCLVRCQDELKVKIKC